ncbi:Gfo/Idh/MocA family protein [Flavisphingomonas formosensis]|uniref:Gfo/Idh/MocA family protein n=1 Tax=Flavisphingomonas formosensis TaxID=861534 RepID=UPI0012FAD78D|nr:Gfo/Idh/MocA family oxidoreductase [Sphingomonas formosensis]
MADRPIRVGIVGVNPLGHWAALAHLPALRRAPADFEVVGVANTSLASARKAADAFGIPHAFSDPQALIDSPEIDLVVITVKVPHHHELVTKALRAGKHIFCEWPLGTHLAQAREMAALARETDAVAVVDTQMRVAVEVEYLRELVADGFVGDVLSTTLFGSAGNSGSAETTQAIAYICDKANGATMLTIPLAHTLVGLQEVLGELSEFSARIFNLRPTARVTDTGETIAKTSPDQVLIQGVLASGAPISIHYRGGMSRGTNLLWEINGTEGDIQVTAPHGGCQMAQLTIHGARGGDKEMKPLTPPASMYEGWPDNPVVRNVARMYALIAQDIRTGSRSAPSFADAVRLHEKLDAFERSSEASLHLQK